MDPSEALLPLPPSLNHNWKCVVRKGKSIVYRSPAYKEWQQVAALAAATGLSRYTAPIAVMVKVSALLPANRDLDNCLKPIIDLLKSTGRIPEDNVKWVRSVSIAIGDDIPKDYCWVGLCELTTG
jgi:Holliday junction resolvase RusA-like endonuclease